MGENKVKCYVCMDGDTDDVLYGEWKSSKGVTAHYFCVLSADCIPQRGKDNQGILGFLPQDIIDCFTLFKDVECYYCGLKSAAVKCAAENCDRHWHYPCGTRNSCMTRFSGKFESYCSLHVPDANEGKKHRNEYCFACMEHLDAYNPADSIISSCCLRLSDWNKCFVHKKCVMSYAKNAGYDSMCINCPMDDGIMTKAIWQEEMRQKGVFIPMEEAVWEQEGQFNDQVKNKCGHSQCTNPRSKSDVWTCFVCGCFPQHLKCARIKTPEEYYCPKCFDQSFVQRVPRFL